MNNYIRLLTIIISLYVSNNYARTRNGEPKDTDPFFQVYNQCVSSCKNHNRDCKNQCAELAPRLYQYQENQKQEEEKQRKNMNEMHALMRQQSEENVSLMEKQRAEERQHIQEQYERERHFSYLEENLKRAPYVTDLEAYLEAQSLVQRAEQELKNAEKTFYEKQRDQRTKLGEKQENEIKNLKQKQNQ